MKLLLSFFWVLASASLLTPALAHAEWVAVRIACDGSNFENRDLPYANLAGTLVLDTSTEQAAGKLDLALGSYWGNFLQTEADVTVSGRLDSATGSILLAARVIPGPATESGELWLSLSGGTTSVVSADRSRSYLSACSFQRL